MVSEKEIQRKRKNIFTFLQAFELEIILFPNIIIKLYLNGFEIPECKLKERKFRLDIMKKILYCEGGNVLEEVAHRPCGYPVTGSVQGKVGGNFELPGHAGRVLACGRGG